MRNKKGLPHQMDTHKKGHETKTQSGHGRVLHYHTTKWHLIQNPGKEPKTL